MELKDKLELLKFKIKIHHQEIEKYNTEIREIEKELYGSSQILVTATTIINEVAKKHNIGAFEIVGRNNKKEIVSARREVCFRLQEMNYTLKRIGEILGGRNHASIFYMLNRRKENVKKASN